MIYIRNGKMDSKDDYNFMVMYKNEEVAFVHVSADHKEVSIKKIMPDGMKQVFNGSKLDLERVYSFLKERCFEDGYTDLENVLEKVGMTSNNPWEWNRKTHGVTWEDYFWVKFEGENIVWEDVKWRD